MNADLAVSLMGLNSQNVVGPIISRMSDVNQKIDDEKTQRIADINNILAIHSTDTERLAAISLLTTNFTDGDTTVTQTLTTAINSEETERIAADTNLQNQVNGNDSDILAHTADILGITQKLGSQTNTTLGILTGQTVLLSTQINGCVKNSGNETISGEKTFSEAATFSSTIEGSSIVGNTSWGASIIPANKLDLSSKQDLISNGDLTIAKTNLLTESLDALGEGLVILGNRTSTNLASLDTTSSVQTQINSKQATITDGDLTIARTNGLQAALDAKQATITDGDLTIARTNGLQAALDAKAPVSTTITNLQITDVGSGAVISSAERTLFSTHSNLHTAHTTAIATKQPKLDTSTLFHDSSTNEGRLGIGTVTPGHMLHLHSTDGNAELKISRNLSDNHVLINSHGITKMGNSAGTTAFRIRQISPDPMVFATSNTDFLTADPNGNCEFAENVTVNGEIFCKNQQGVRFYESVANGTDSVRIQAAANSATYTLKLPTASGNDGQNLCLSGSNSEFRMARQGEWGDKFPHWRH